MNIVRTTAFASLFFLIAASSTAIADVFGPQETAQRAAPQYTPDFEAQFRAPAPQTASKFIVDEFATGLSWPWAIESMPGGSFLVTEKAGAMRVISPEGNVSPPIKGLPEVFVGLKGGLLDVALSPDFAQTNRIFWTYAEPREDGSGTAVATAILSEDLTILHDIEVIWRLAESSRSEEHYGSRIAFDQSGNLFVSLGERSPDSGSLGREAILDLRDQAQLPTTDLGKIIRIGPDGSIPLDNPFADSQDVKPDIWAFGFRNPLALAVHPKTGLPWTAEHGPKAGDELNEVHPAGNYGWPVTSFGIEYKGQPVGGGVSTATGMEPPKYFWDPNIAPGGMVFYEGEEFPNWRGNILLTGLKSQRISRLVICEGVVKEEEWLSLPGRIRDIGVDQDGLVYVVTDAEDAKVLRLKAP